MNGDQQFQLALVVQVVTLVGLVINWRQSVRNGQTARSASEKVDSLTVQVNGKIQQLLDEKDITSGLSSRVAHAEGMIEGRDNRRRRASDPPDDRAWHEPNV